MKKLFTSLFLLMLGVMTVNAWTLRVCGAIDPSAGYVNAGQSEGTIYWDGSGTLTLTDVTLSSIGYLIDYHGTNTLTVKFVGTNTLISSGNIGIYSEQSNVIVTGVRGVCATATIKSTAGPAIWVNGSHSLTIQDIFLTAEGYSGCIRGTKSSSTLTIMEAVITASTSNSMGAVADFSSATFYDDAYLTTGSWNSTVGAVCDDNGNPLKNVTFDTPLIVGSTIVPLGFNSDMNIHPSALTSGTIKYSYNSKTLKFSNAKMESVGGNAIKNNGIDGLIIQIEGENEIKGSDIAAIMSEKSLTIKGDGHLLSGNASLVLTNNWTGIYVKSGTLTFDNATVGVGSDGYGLSGNNAASLVFKNSLFIANNASKGNIMKFTNCTFDGCCVNTFFSAEGVCWRKSLSGFGTVSELAKGDMACFVNVPTTWYEVSILGQKLSDINLTNFCVDGLTAGSVTYDKDNKVLTLDGVKMTGPEEISSEVYAIAGSSIEKIVFNGNNEITNDGTCFYLTSNVTMEGTGKIIATSNKHSGIYNGTGLTINVANTAKFFGLKNGIWGDYSPLTLKKASGSSSSDYYFMGTNVAAVRAASLTLTDMDYWSGSDGTPGCYFDEGDKMVMQNGGVDVKGDDKVVNFYKLDDSDKYGIRIAGVPLTRHNHFGLGSKYITAGGPQAVTSDTNGHIALDNVTIDTGNADCSIITEASIFDNLTFTIYGDCELKQAAGWMNTYFSKNTTINGDGNLTIGYDLSFNGDKTLTLDNVNINAGVIEGSIDDPKAKLVVKLTTPGKRIRANRVRYFKSLDLQNGTQILEPEGAHFDAAQYCVVDASGAVASGVVFADASATGIEGVIMNADAEVRDIFDAEGRQLNEMQNGVNIVRMSDGTTRKVIKK